MTFAPDFATSGAVYLSFTRTGLVSYVSRFFSFDGGQLAFGSDGFLYIGFGDGGSANDPNNREQDTANVMGSIYVLDYDSGRPFRIVDAN